ncbi:methyltransferase domain-containing protein [Streptomyces sp. NPDC005181]|uniref:methyltransferase domain-containing protein n=1 Tax=Streptomyces sp. NPDC005181 TaxID=3156869 RepID=UPI0033A4E3FC
MDVGCGTGALSELIAEAGHRITGVGPALRTAEQARAALAAAGLEGRRHLCVLTAVSRSGTDDARFVGGRLVRASRSEVLAWSPEYGIRPDSS